MTKSEYTHRVFNPAQMKLIAEALRNFVVPPKPPTLKKEREATDIRPSAQGLASSKR